MIKFVNIKDGSVFDGHLPYIHWFEEGQSTNLMYIKQICFVSDKSEVSISMPSNPVFCLIDSQRLVSEESLSINNEIYKDINGEGIKTFEIISEGAPYQDLWVHMIYIMACAEAEGEVREALMIDDEEFSVGGDFYNEDERLSIEMINKGKDINKAIQKAVYCSDVHEDANDNILLNRKFKELLNGYLDIIMKKGSYRSLQSSLNWFEYGELLRLWEFWKIREVGSDRYLGDEIRPIVDETVRRLMTTSHRTTYIGISLALQSIGDEYGDELTPQTTNKIFLWTALDMSLKMALLGRFIKTYFLPIHLDELHCTMESVIFSRPMIWYSTASLRRNDHIDHIGAVSCSVHNGDRFYLGNVSARVFPDTVFGLEYEFHREGDETAAHTSERIDMSSIKDDSLMRIFGVDDDKDYVFPHGESYNSRLGRTGLFTLGVSQLGCDDEEDGQSAIKNFSYQYFNGIGVKIPFTITFPKLNMGDRIERGTILASFGDKLILFKDFGPKMEDSILKFELLLENEGDYDLYMKFETASGVVFIHKVSISVSDETCQAVRMYRLRKLTSDEIMKNYPHGPAAIRHIYIPGAELGIFVINESKLGQGPHQEDIIEPHNFSIEARDTWPVSEYTLSDYMVSMTKHPTPIRYNQFLAVNPSALATKISSNTMTVIRGERRENGSYRFYFTLNGIPFSCDTDQSEESHEGLDNLIGQLVTAFPSFLWMAQWRWAFHPDKAPEGIANYKIPYIIGLNCDFTVKDRMMTIYDAVHNVIRLGQTHSSHIVWKYDMMRGGSVIDCDHMVEFLGEDGEYRPSSLISTGEKYIYNRTIRARIVFEANSDRDIYKYITISLPDIWNIPEEGWWGLSTVNRINPTITSVSCYDTDNHKHGEIWLREVLMPAFYRPELCEDDVLSQDDVVCFLPDIGYLRGLGVEDVMWEFRNVTTGETITPLTYRPENQGDRQPDIHQPFFGRFDYRILPDKGFYDITLTYRLSSDMSHTNIHKAKSQFVIR